ncbi:anti-anti-sigma factor [Mycolicibacterium holsaticum]|uniref:Anti-anti-sigma factor n=1 Tax=Mycolicibacterium holsaticum TaxID=152142 RepID=A0A1E3RSQ7_9MYCO|nr:anti-anti-sigma factor [Mycolicibacterium holsaticum]ODQ92933.1 anti-anti-sigma factor [Mycolicibacterium holsaticum]QZA12267.1 anti-anti-sigma factor [Mycolicibacterium holsaticum DSM 44478 = JCM 12374]UNC10247.1 anti-anti-sigma factor [Mycolicibacterium holsaticum DSM 44478 = JCM 12374]
MYGNPTFDCAGAQIHAVCRQLATVVTVDGVIDDTNIERVNAFARRFVLAEKAFVLDLSGVTSFTPHCVSLLYAVDDSCYHAEVEWSLVTSPAVENALGGVAAGFPVAASVPDALHQFAAGIDERRRLLPLLTKKTA